MDQRNILGIPAEAFTPEVMEIANDILQIAFLEIEEGESRARINALTETERKALYAAIADGFNDTTDD